MTQLTLTLPPETAARIEAQAAAQGVTAERWAQDALARLLGDWAQALAALDETGADIDADEAFAQLDAAIAVRHDAWRADPSRARPAAEAFARVRDAIRRHAE